MTTIGKSALTVPEGEADWLAQLKGQIVQAPGFGTLYKK